MEVSTWDDKYTVTLPPIDNKDTDSHPAFIRNMASGTPSNFLRFTGALAPLVAPRAR